METERFSRRRCAPTHERRSAGNGPPCTHFITGLTLFTAAAAAAWNQPQALHSAPAPHAQVTGERALCYINNHCMWPVKPLRAALRWDFHLPMKEKNKWWCYWSVVCCFSAADHKQKEPSSRLNASSEAATVSELTCRRISLHTHSGETKHSRGSERQEVDTIVENNHAFRFNSFAFAFAFSSTWKSRLENISSALQA